MNNSKMPSALTVQTLEEVEQTEAEDQKTVEEAAEMGEGHPLVHGSWEEDLPILFFVTSMKTKCVK